ncbi:hypothetical protein [Flavobacterium sp.]|uniref:hypothetical protein n=1 Tax=Flavobacterium sp. TaxID=239 RepID=UPI0037BF8D48
MNEVFKSNSVDLVYDNKNESLLYYDIEGPLKGDIGKQLVDLRMANQEKFLILDNCSKTEHDKYVQLFKNTKVRIISIATVKSNLDTDHANVFLDEEITKEIHESVLTKKFDSVGKKVPIELVSLSLSETITFLENNVEEETGDRTIIELLETIIGEDNLKNGAFEFLQIISLFGAIGVSDRYVTEINSIKSFFLNDMGDDNINNNIQILIAKKLLSKKVDYILITGFEEELIADWWVKKKASLNEILKKLEGTGLLFKFINRIMTNLNEEFQKELNSLLFSDNSILYDNDFSESLEGAEFINKLTIEFPLEVLDIMDKKINNE